jgi:uncharacterized protein
MLVQKIKAVEKILKEVSKQTSAFGLRNNITCIRGCGKCCITPNIEVSPLEFLPAAYELYKQGRIYDCLEKVQNLEEGKPCIFFYSESEESENCTIYSHRGLICRVFGYSARKSKNNQIDLITCQIIKQSPPYQNLNQQSLKLAPVASDFYMQLSNIDIREGNNIKPINQAIKSAMEAVLLHFSYSQKKPA